MTRVTMRDVATAAGVSVATVSRVLSGARQVDPELVATVESTCERLGYRRNNLARALRRRTTQTAGMIVPHIANPFFAGAVQAVERALQAQGYGLLLGDSRDDPDLEAAHVRALIDRRVDGLLMIPCEADASGPAVAEAVREVPIVLLDRWIEGIDADGVAVDNEAGIDAVLEHLAGIGRMHPAFVGAAESIPTARERLGAYRRGVRRTHATNAGELLGDFSVEWGRKAALEILARARRPDAIVCGNDLIALGVLEGLRESGVDVPSAMAVTGFDDIGFATIAYPSLTTVRQPIDAIGTEAARLLLERIAGYEGAPRRARLMPDLIVRESTAG